jgi:hypothetical protein
MRDCCVTMGAIPSERETNSPTDQQLCLNQIWYDVHAR